MTTFLIIALIIAMYLFGWHAATAHQLKRIIAEQRQFISELLSDEDEDEDEDDGENDYEPTDPNLMESHRWN